MWLPPPVAMSHWPVRGLTAPETMHLPGTSEPGGVRLQVTILHGCRSVSVLDFFSSKMVRSLDTTTIDSVRGTWPTLPFSTCLAYIVGYRHDVTSCGCSYLCSFALDSLLPSTLSAANAPPMLRQHPDPCICFNELIV